MLIYYLQNFTGGKEGGKHITDVTNASRTMLMNIHDLKWDQKLCRYGSRLNIENIHDLKWDQKLCRYRSRLNIENWIIFNPLYTGNP